MSDTIIIKVDVQDGEAIAKLTQLDALGDKLNKKPILVSLGAGTQSAQAMQGALAKVGKEAAATGTAAKAMGHSFGKTALKLGGLRLLFKTVEKVKTAFVEAGREIKNVDAELTNIQKVTNMSNAEIKKLGDSAYKTASQYGVAANEYLESVTIFSKAGYKEQAESLGELAIKTQLVGDVSAEMASKFLLSVDAAYKMGGSVNSLSTVLDKANEVENNYATSIEKIAEGMPIVASVANSAHMSVDQTIAALGTITATTQESGTMAARALRALILNILGDTETAIEDGVTWTEGEINSLTDILWKYSRGAMEAAQATGEVVNPMEAIAGLSKAFKEGALTEAELVGLVSDLGGKLRTNQLIALIKGFDDTYTAMLGSMEDAAGSADKEVDTMLSSWDAKSKILKNSWTQFVSDLLDTDTVKTGIDTITAGIDALDEALKGTGDRAEETRTELEKDFSLKYGEGSHYQELIANQEHLNDLQRHELQLLEAQKEIDEKRVELANQIEMQSRFAEWNTERGTGKYAPLLQGGTRQDIADLQEFQRRFTAMNKEYTRTLDSAALHENMQSLLTDYDEARQKLRAFKDGGMELSAEQEKLLTGAEALFAAYAEGGEGIEVYAQSMKAQFQALGMSEQEAEDTVADYLTKWAEGMEGLEDGPEIDIQTDTAEAAVDALTDSLENIPNRTVYIDVITREYGSPSVSSKNDKGFTGGSTKFAAGTRNAPGGPALVNDGSGPEIIAANGAAFIAGGGRPTIVDLPKGATVLTAEESRTALKGSTRLPVPSYKGGTTSLAEQAAGRTSIADEVKKAIDKMKKGSGKKFDDIYFAGDHDWGGIEDEEPSKWTPGPAYRPTGGGSSAPSGPDFGALEDALSETLKNLDAQAELAENEERFVDAMKIYNQAQEKIGELLDKYRAAGYDPDSNEILTLANMGYKYAASQTDAYSTAREKLIDALESLTRSTDNANRLQEREQEIADAKAELANVEAQRNVRIFNTTSGQWEWTANPEDIKAAAERVRDAEKAFKKEQIEQNIDALKNTEWENIGAFELSPALLELLNSGTDAQKEEFARQLGILTGGIDNAPSMKATQFTGNHDSHDIHYNFNGVEIGDAQAENMTLKQLANELSPLKMQTGQ